MSRNRGFKRVDRLNRQILETLSSIFLKDVRDPRLNTIQLTAVKVSGDLGHARVYYILMDDEQSAEQSAAAFDKIQGFIRSRLSDALRLKHTPRLAFVYDESVENGRHMDALFARMKQQDTSEDEEA